MTFAFAEGDVVRNVFDQYDESENKLTHALYSTLTHDRSLIVPFLRWLGAADIPAEKDVRIVEQQVPGTALSDDDGEGKGLADLFLYSDAGWAVACEMKVQRSIHDDAGLAGGFVQSHFRDTWHRGGHLLGRQRRQPQKVVVGLPLSDRCRTLGVAKR